MSVMYQQLLDQISAMRKGFGLSIQPGCSDKDLLDLQDRARKELGVEIPPGYAQFLRQHDGLNWNGLFIYASKTVPIAGHKSKFIHGFVDINLLFRDNKAWKKKFVVFGDSSLDFYAYEPEKQKYSIRDRTSFDETESFSSFEEMLSEALRIHL